MTIYVHDWAVSPYAVCMLLALAVGFGGAYLLLRRQGIEARLAGLSALMNIVFVLLGGKLYTIIVNAFQCYAGVVAQNADCISTQLAADTSGRGILGRLLYSPFSSVGGLLGMIGGIELFCLMLGDELADDKKAVREVYILQIPLIYSISKAGCFLMGCCYGISYNGPGHICYETQFADTGSEVAQSILNYLPQGNLFPIQLVTSLIFMGIYVSELIRYKKKTSVAIELLILGGLAKFLEEFLRADRTGLLDSNQLVCLIVIAIALIILRLKKAQAGQEGN